MPDIDPDYPIERWSSHWDELKSQGSLIFENRHRTKNGHLFPVEIAANYVEYEGVAYSLALVPDITERHRIEAAFSTPLRAIDGFSRMLSKKYEARLDQEGQRLIKVVRDNTARMLQLIDDILAFSRAGRLELRLGKVDMAPLVRTTWLVLEPLRAGRDIRLELKPLAPARGDPAILRQVWSNLLANAIKFTRPRATAHIQVGGMTESEDYLYYVRDHGAGFDPAYKHKLFGVFQRLHGVEDVEGTGLAIVKRIIVRHGGQIMAEGKPDQGATFKFSLPVSRT